MATSERMADGAPNESGRKVGHTVGPTESDRYMRAMIEGHTGVCASIEQRHGLYGYPPEIVSVGLQAVDEGGDPEAAILAYIGGEPLATGGHR